MGTLPAGRSVAKPTRVRFVVLAFLCTLSLLTYLDRVCISQGQRDIQFELRISDEWMGDVLGAFAIGYMLFEVPAGWMGDRWGTIPPMKSGNPQIDVPANQRIDQANQAIQTGAYVVLAVDFIVQVAGLAMVTAGAVGERVPRAYAFDGRNFRVVF